MFFPEHGFLKLANRNVAFSQVALLFVAVLWSSSSILSASPPKSGRETSRPVEEVTLEVNRLLNEIWEEGFLESDGQVPDNIFLRRMSIDIRGVIPHAEEVVNFVGDKDLQKILKWSDWFINTPEYADYFAETWERILLGRRGNTDGLDREGFRRWLRKAFIAGQPYNELVADLLTSTGTPDESPAVNFFLRYGANNSQEMAKDITARISRVFLGTRIECAQCHDHPYFDVKREEFWGMAAFFTQTERYRLYDRAGGNSDRRGIRDSYKGEIAMPPMKMGEKAVAIPPIYFGDGYTKPKASKTRAKKSNKKGYKKAKTTTKRTSKKTSKRKPQSSRRQRFARWVTSADNKYFSRSFINRLWSHFMGKGFVNPVDAFTLDSKIVYSDLLEYLAEDFELSGYDIKRMIRIIVSTQAYRHVALRAIPGGVAKGESHDYFSTIPIRPLEAEVLARSILRATGLEEPHSKRNADRVRRFVRDTKSEIGRRFSVDETEKREEFQGTVLQALLLFNGRFTDGSAPASRAFHPDYEKKTDSNLDIVLQGVAPDRKIHRLFLVTLSRHPTEEELATFNQHVLIARNDEERRDSLSDVQWALLNSAEFLHQH